MDGINRKKEWLHLIVAVVLLALVWVFKDIVATIICIAFSAFVLAWIIDMWQAIKNGVPVKDVSFEGTVKGWYADLKKWFAGRKNKGTDKESAKEVEESAEEAEELIEEATEEVDEVIEEVSEDVGEAVEEVAEDVEEVVEKAMPHPYQVD